MSTMRVLTNNEFSSTGRTMASSVDLGNAGTVDTNGGLRDIQLIDETTGSGTSLPHRSRSGPSKFARYLLKANQSVANPSYVNDQSSPTAKWLGLPGARLSSSKKLAQLPQMVDSV